jgi:hypothetical protein
MVAADGGVVLSRAAPALMRSSAGSGGDSGGGSTRDASPDAAALIVEDDGSFELALEELLRHEPDWGDAMVDIAARGGAMLDGEAWAASSGAGEHNGSAVGDDAGAGALTSTKAAPLHLHRCLDRAHAQPCALCTPAPAEDEEGACARTAVMLLLLC